MRQHELHPPAGARHRRKRIGRGNASGHGTYSGKGMKGQKSRSGGGVRPGFEGGQLPLIRRLARKRGFRSPFRIDYEEVNVGSLARFAAGTEVTAASLAEARLVRSRRKPVKVLGDGEISVALTVEATSFTASARSKIEAAGGSVRWLDGEPQLAPEGGETKKAKRIAEAKAKAQARRDAAEAAKAAKAAAPPEGKRRREKAAPEGKRPGEKAAKTAGAEAGQAKAPKQKRPREAAAPKADVTPDEKTREAPSQADATSDEKTDEAAPPDAPEEDSDGTGS